MKDLKEEDLPWEAFGADPQVIVFDELWGLMRMVHMIQVNVQTAQRNRWESNEEGKITPHFGTASWKCEKYWHLVTLES